MDTPPITMPAFLLLLHIVSAGEPMYGRQLAVASRQVEDVVYPALRRLESLGLLFSKEEEADSDRVGSPRRRYYHATAAGVAVTTGLRAEIERVVDVHNPALRPPGVLGTSGGVPLTEELLDTLADEAEHGYAVERMRRRS